MALPQGLALKASNKVEDARDVWKSARAGNLERSRVDRPERVAYDRLNQELKD